MHVLNPPMAPPIPLPLSLAANVLQRRDVGAKPKRVKADETRSGRGIVRSQIDRQGGIETGRLPRALARRGTRLLDNYDREPPG
jgi:hypothetical protein